jgi:hypothetical protein
MSTPTKDDPDIRDRCVRGLHNYVGRSYVQIAPKRYVQVCWACGQTDYCDGVATEVAPRAGDAG